MENVVRTIYGSYLQTCLKLSLAHSIPAFSTLNEKIGVQSGVMPSPGVYPTVGYYCIGNKGHTNTVGADGIGLTTIAQHKATDAALFNQVPFVLREVTNDITPTERAKYALRKEVVYGGITYIAYYLRRIDKTTVVAQMEYRTDVDGNTVVTPFVPTSTNLNPTPVVIPNTGSVNVVGDYALSTAHLPISFTPDEVAEYINVANIIYGTDTYAIISEIGLCSGVDKLVTVTPSVGVAFNFTEAIGVQITSHISTMHLAKYSNSGISKILDIGTNDPLYNVN